MKLAGKAVKLVWRIYQWADSKWDLTFRLLAALQSWLALPAVAVPAVLTATIGRVVSTGLAANLLVTCLLGWPLALASRNVRGWCRSRFKAKLFRLKWDDDRVDKYRIPNAELGCVKFRPDGNLEYLIIKPNRLKSEFGMVAEVFRIFTSPAWNVTWETTDRPDWIRISTSSFQIPEIICLTADTVSPDPSVVALGESSDETDMEWGVNKAPHMLITGRTGKGKGGTLRVMLLHAIAHKDQWTADVISAKPTGEFEWFKRHGGTVHTPNLSADGVDISDMAEVVLDARHEVIERALFMEEHGLDHWEQAMETFPDKKRQLLVIDEFKAFDNALSARTGDREIDKELTARKAAVIKAVQDIAAMARTVGIHLIIATQKADVDAVGGGSTLNNLTARIVTAASQKATEQALDETTETTSVGLPNIPGRVFHKDLNGSDDEPLTGQIRWIEQDDIDGVLERFAATV